MAGALCREVSASLPAPRISTGNIWFRFGWVTCLWRKWDGDLPGNFSLRESHPEKPETTLFSGGKRCVIRETQQCSPKKNHLTKRMFLKSVPSMRFIANPFQYFPQSVIILAKFMRATHRFCRRTFHIMETLPKLPFTAYIFWGTDHFGTFVYVRRNRDWSDRYETFVILIS